MNSTRKPRTSWAAHCFPAGHTPGAREVYSGKHKTTGMNAQVACTIYGKITWVSGPVNGSRHDNYWLGDSDVLRTLKPQN